MKVVVFYYSQTGQAKRVADFICRPLEQAENDGAAVTVCYKEIVPQQHYLFPWSKEAFFDVFPETRLGIPPSGIAPMDFSDVQDADLVVVVGQSWFLSPSLPLQSFFLDRQVREYLSGRDVIFVNVCRNMWLMTARKIKAYLKDIQARLVGHIVLQDEAPNLVSVLTIIRWLMYGKKEATALLPPAGVSGASICWSSCFGKVMLKALRNKDFSTLQRDMLSYGAIHYKPSVLFLEKMGHRMFGLWAQFIRRKGEMGNPKRRWRTQLFYYYLLTVLFLLSPFAQLGYRLCHLFSSQECQRRIDCGVDYQEE